MQITSCPTIKGFVSIFASILKSIHYQERMSVLPVLKSNP